MYVNIGVLLFCGVFHFMFSPKNGASTKKKWRPVEQCVKVTNQDYSLN